MDDAVLALQRMGASLRELDLSELSARKPLTWCLAEESSRKMLSALVSFRHPCALQSLALPPANPFYAVANCLTSTYTSLTRLKMRFGHSLTDRGFAALSDMARLSRLTSLEFVGRFGNDECEALALALARMSGLCTLALKSECIGARGCRALGSSFPGLVSLEELCLRVADIGLQVALGVRG